MKTKMLLSWDNGKRPIDRIQMVNGVASCPNDFPHSPHSNAVWTDWHDVEVWNCSGQNWRYDNGE